VPTPTEKGRSLLGCKVVHMPLCLGGAWNEAQIENLSFDV